MFAWRAARALPLASKFTQIRTKCFFFPREWPLLTFKEPTAVQKTALILAGAEDIARPDVEGKQTRLSRVNHKSYHIIPKGNITFSISTLSLCCTQRCHSPPRRDSLYLEHRH